MHRFRTDNLEHLVNESATGQSLASALPRLEFASFQPELAQLLEPRVNRLGYLGEFFKCGAHQPEALCAFIRYTESCKAALPKKLVELIALTCATWTGNAYERNQHERLSIRLGYGREWVTAVEALKPEGATPLAPEERSVQRLTLSVLDTRGKGAHDLFEQAVVAHGPEQAVAMLMVIGRYMAHGLFVNTLRLAPPVPSIFEDGFNG